MTVSPSSSRKLFVVGAPRSGTSLVRDLINRSPDIALLEDELQVLPQLIELSRNGATWQEMEKLLRASAYGARRVQDGSWPGKAAFAQALNGLDGIDLLDALFIFLIGGGSEEGVVYIGEKTPENIFALRKIAETWPDCFFLFVRRDPRATVYSMHRSWGRSIVRGAEIWRQASATSSRWTTSGSCTNSHVIRYEDLLDDPRAELAKAFDALGVTPEFAGLDAQAKPDEWSPSRRTAGIARQDSNWRKQLSPRDQLLIEQIAYEQMMADGYEPELATSGREVGRIRLAMASLGDAIRVLRSYTKSKGLVSGLTYKLRQWSARYLVTR
ncbi:sulfotransferase [Qipengyuania sp. XHP0207]|uniref:sulfotransferase family protein n=1 Tax=Qipengyuania sp. XHP0207 TaxID=3038078 RepID=UPI00241E3804|nr:sulfotransferase [Qipengyuania sp. XHP0207]MDG5747279.1 sulfotransferase [Qipengyuania sp. XHP0207]